MIEPISGGAVAFCGLIFALGAVIGSLIGVAHGEKSQERWILNNFTVVRRKKPLFPPDGYLDYGESEPAPLKKKARK